MLGLGLRHRSQVCGLQLPFSVDQFFGAFAAYNRAVWPAQVLLYISAFAVIVLLFWNRPSGSRIISLTLSFLWAWMAIAYHFAFFARINPAARIFAVLFLVQAAYFLIAGAIRRRLRFQATASWENWAGGVLIVFALVAYPLLGLAAGERFPAFPTFGLPCPTTLFTLGNLLFMERPLPKFAFAVPLLWAGIGSLAAFQLHVFQDLSLLLSGLAVVVVFVARIFTSRAVEVAGNGVRR